MDSLRPCTLTSVYPETPSVAFRGVGIKKWDFLFLAKSTTYVFDFADFKTQRIQASPALLELGFQTTVVFIRIRKWEQSLDNRREHQRIPLRVSIKITHPQIGEKIVQTKDISDGGLFILADPSELPAPGEIVKGQVQGMVDEAPIVEMKIVRVMENGIGLQYILSKSKDSGKK